jgi:predicted O-methyltransferase YrrM
MQGPFDIIYLDAHKGEYIDYLNIILDKELLAPTGIILANDGAYHLLLLWYILVDLC